MFIPELAAAKDVEPDTSLAAYFSDLPKNKMDVGFALTDVISTVFHRTIEAAWPSALKVGRLMNVGWSTSVDMWSYEAVETGNPWHVSFIAEKKGSMGGFLFTCVLNKERSEAFKASRTLRHEGTSKLETAEERRKAIAAMIIEEVKKDEKASVFDPAEYENPQKVTIVDEFKIHVFRGTEKPDFYDGHATTLDELLIAVRNDGYAHGLVATCHPTDDRFATRPAASSSDRCSEAATTLTALRVLEGVLDKADLMKEVAKRSRAVSSRRYLHYGDERSMHLAEAAQLAVFADGGYAGPHCFDTVWEFWRDAANHDLNRTALQMSETFSSLLAAGHDSVDNRYDANDGRDRAFVTALADGISAIWLETQHGKFGVFMKLDGTGTPDSIVLARVERDFGKSISAVNRGDKGFLGAFKAVLPDPEDGKPRYDAALMGKMTDRTIRDLNGVLISLDSVHCCMSEDARDAKRALQP